MVVIRGWVSQRLGKMLDANMLQVYKLGERLGKMLGLV